MISSQKRRLLFATALLGVAVVTGCGGGAQKYTPPQQGTPAGTYTIVVTATYGSLSHNATLTLTVN